MKDYLVDSSAWILSFSPSPPPNLADLLQGALDKDRVFVCGIVIAEILQGCRAVKERERLRDYFEALPYLRWSEPDWTELGETSARLRSSGVAVPVMDLMIAILAIRHRATLLHRDRHFDLIASELPLKVEKV